MSLRILIIGRGSVPSERVANGHLLEFQSNARPSGSVLSMENYDFVFQHLSTVNPEAADAIAEWISKGWKQKIVGFSGGQVPSNLSSQPIPQIEHLLDRQSIIDLAWVAVPINFNGDAQELLTLLKPRKLELLPALAILCQGYLAVHAAYANSEVPDWKSEDILPALDQMGWSALVSRMGSGGLLIRPNLGTEKNNVRKQSWWLQTFGVLDESQKLMEEKWIGFKNNLMYECGKGVKAGIPAELNILLDALGREESMVEPKVVADAYSAIAIQLAKE